MNIEKLKEIVNRIEWSDEMKEKSIIETLAKDPKVIPILMQILDAERNRKHELIAEMNLELSRADIHIQEPILAARDKSSKNEHLKQSQAREFVLNHITAFYVKWKGEITHSFNKQV